MRPGWYVHIEGPDDMILMPSREAAETEALALNASIERTVGPNPHPYTPVFRARAMQVPAPDQPTPAEDCPSCHHTHAGPCTARVGGVPGFPSTRRACGCSGGRT